MICTVIFSVYEGDISVLNFSNELRALQSAATPQPITVSSVPTTRPWPIRQKRIGTSRMISVTRHSSESGLGRKDSPLGCLHLAYTYTRDSFVVGLHSQVYLRHNHRNKQGSAYKNVKPPYKRCVHVISRKWIFLLFSDKCEIVDRKKKCTVHRT